MPPRHSRGPAVISEEDIVHLSNYLYLLGSLCFMVGTLLNMRGGR